MKYIWNKTKLLDFINEWVKLTWLKSWIFFDAFSWTASVAKFFKKKWFNIISNDLMFYSYVEQKAYIENNTIPIFRKLFNFLKLNSDNINKNLDIIIDYLNDLNWIEWFIYKNYCPTWSKKYSNQERQYFTDYNWKKIDTIRNKIDEWKKENLINENEYFILLSILLNEADYLANISWTYWAYLKIWRSVATNKLHLKKRELILSDKLHRVYNKNTNELINEIKNIDITYIDIPYNQRQYSSNFHILETIAKNDNPTIKGITGQREDSIKKSSNYCKKRFVINETEELIKNLDSKYILFSYSSDWLMNYEDLKKILDKYWKKIKILKKIYRRFKTDNSRKYKNEWKDLVEYLFVYKK